MFADVRRGLAIAAVVTAATVTDTDGNAIDTDRVLRPARDADAAEPTADAASRSGGRAAADAKPERATTSRRGRRPTTQVTL